MSNKAIDVVLWIGFAATLLLLAFYTTRGLSLGYSYWTDELFSVTAATESLAMQWRILRADVHPPLYHGLLAGWVTLVGTSESATRGLSTVFVALGLLSLIRLDKAFPRALVLLFGALLMSNALLASYAQETRSYGLLLSLATWAVVLFVSDERRWIFPVLVALGTTHFFGTLLAGLCLLWLLAEGRSSSRVVVATLISGAAILVWPMVFLLLGSGMDVMGGAFWIASTTVDVGKDALGAAFPFAVIGMVIGGAERHWIVLAVLLAATLAIILGSARRKGGERLSNAGWKTAYLCVGSLGAVTAINMVTPISTERNFIVLVPVGAFLMALALYRFLDGRAAPARIAGLTLAVVVVLANAAATSYSMLERFTPRQDWRAAAEALVADAPLAPGQSVYIFDSFPTLDLPAFNTRYMSHYLPEGMPVDLLHPDELEGLDEGAVIYFGHMETGNARSGVCRNTLIDQLDAMGRAYEGWFAPQHLMCHTGYLVLR